MSSKFTEQETEIYYDSEDAFYRSFWDEGGSVHWGVFDESTGDDFLLGGRSVPIFLTIGTTVATMVGTGSSMGAVGFGYANGWAGALYGIGGSIGVLLLAFCFAPVRKFRFMTMSE